MRDTGHISNTWEESVWCTWEITFICSTGFIDKWVTLSLELKVEQQWMRTTHSEKDPFFNTRAGLNCLKMPITALSTTSSQPAVRQLLWQAPFWVPTRSILPPKHRQSSLTPRHFFISPVYPRTVLCLFGWVIISQQCFQVLGFSQRLLIPVFQLALKITPLRPCFFHSLLINW